MTISHKISWADAAREAADHLAHILALGTSTPPAWELPAAKYLLTLFESEGIPAIILPPGSAGRSDYSCGDFNSPRPNLVAHIPGSGADDPILLLSHLDSAPRNLNDWSRPAISIDNTLRGPGALMGTHLSVAHAMALILMARNRLELRRTIRYAATSGGAGGRGSGLRVLAENHLEHITSDLALSWGSFSFIDRENKLCSIFSTSEKGSIYLKIRSESMGGRIGVRCGRNPIDSLVKALVRLGEIEFPARSSAMATEFVRSLMQAVDLRKHRTQMENLLSETNIDRILAQIESDSSFDPGLAALMGAAYRTVQTIGRIHTVSSDGLKPSIAEAEILYCYPPGENAENIALRVMDALKNDGVYLAEKIITEPSASDPSPDVIAFARAALNEVDPDAKLITGFSPWPTGLSSLRFYETGAYGWEPFVEAGSLSETLSRRGGHKESLDLSAFEKEIRAFYSFLIRSTQ